MDILINLIAVFCLIVLFILFKYSSNPLINVGIIMISITCLVIAVNTPLYYISGFNTTYIYNASVLINSVEYPITENFDSYNYIFIIFYVVSVICSVVYWGIENPNKRDE